MSATVSRPRSLSSRIRIAISTSNLADMYDLRDICDRIHTTGEPYNGYTTSDLPTDALYEELVRAITALSSATASVISTVPPSSSPITTLDDLWMGSITKLADVPNLGRSLLSPKFDGCSCGIVIDNTSTTSKPSFTVTRAVTRGQSSTYTTKRSDLTDRIVDLTGPITTALNTHFDSYSVPDDRQVDPSDFPSSPSSTSSFPPSFIPLSTVTRIIIRGEIVINDKSVTDSASAAYVAGKINGRVNLWREAVPFLSFVPFEIMRIYIRDEPQPYIPSQFIAFRILKDLHLINFPVAVVTLTEPVASLATIRSFYDAHALTRDEPVDGVVYSTLSWRYPSTSMQTTAANYNKYAWKPSSEATSTLREVSWTVSQDGKFNFILSYDPVMINGKRFRNAKTAYSRLVELTGIGIGSPITVRLSRDISPIVDGFEEVEGVEPLTLPDECPYCGTAIEIRHKGAVHTYACPNAACPEVLKQRMISFLRTIGVKGIAEGKLNGLNGDMRLRTVDERLLRGKGVMLATTLSEITDARTFVLSVIKGGKVKADRMMQKHGVNPLMLLGRVWDGVAEMLDEECGDDPFVMDVVGYVNELMA